MKAVKYYNMKLLAQLAVSSQSSDVARSKLISFSGNTKFCSLQQIVKIYTHCYFAYKKLQPHTNNFQCKLVLSAAG